MIKTLSKLGIQENINLIKGIYEKTTANLSAKSKLVLLTERQANKSRDEVLGQGIATLFGKPVDCEDGGLVYQRTVLPESEFRLLLY